MRTLMIVVAAAPALPGCATGSPPTSHVSGLDSPRVEAPAGRLPSVDAIN